jgi:peptidoglycan hydrolase-like protein with peptidoglycan-binding domain
MVVIVTNTAADPDIPANVLSFDLQPDAPLSATLDSHTGLFTWATTDADANTTNVITIKVTDDGLPKLSDARGFSITVVPRPMFTEIPRTNDGVGLTWTAIAGLSYELQFSGPETSQLWTNLQTVVAAGNGTASGTDAVSFAEQRLYRVRVVP